MIYNTSQSFTPRASDYGTSTKAPSTVSTPRDTTKIMVWGDEDPDEPTEPTAKDSNSAKVAESVPLKPIAVKEPETPTRSKPLPLPTATPSVAAHGSPAT